MAMMKAKTKKPSGSLYTIWPTKEPKSFRISKMSMDLDALETYFISEVGNTMICACPAGGRATCRHREMLRLFQGLNKVGSGEFYQYDSELWYDNTGKVIKDV